MRIPHGSSTTGGAVGHLYLWLAVLRGLARVGGQMKLILKRGSAASGAPEDMHAPSGADAPWAGRGPAPAGALHRASADSYSTIEETGADQDEAYVPVRGKMGFRVRGALRSAVGRAVLGVIAFVGLGAVATAMILTRSFLLNDERFVIPASAHIETLGNTHLTRAQMLSVFGADMERNVFRVPLAERRADLERLPWVQHATVMRLLPNTLRVSVEERTPVAFVREGTTIGLVDASGVLLDMPADAPGDPHYSFPVLTGISAGDPLSTRAARMEIYRRFMKELDSAGGKVTESFSEVDISNPEDVKALIASGSTDILVHFGDEEFLTRYRHFEEHLAAWKQQYPKLASADMRYEQQVVLEMAAGAAPPANNAVASNAGDSAKPTVDVAAAVAPKPVVRAPVVRAPRGPVAKPVSAAGARTSSANAKMFAALVAARQQQAKDSTGKRTTGQGPR
jgi:cell division protein FtsQ